MPELPHGTVALLFTDVEGSTELQRRLGERYHEVAEAHRRLLDEARHGGQVLLSSAARALLGDSSSSARVCQPLRRMIAY